jgi:hypothetical protein
LIEKKLLDPCTFVVDYNTGANVFHYVGHFGKMKALKVLLTKFRVDPNTLDFYKLTCAHYAARTGELGVLSELSKIENCDVNRPDCYGYTPLNYSIMFSKIYAFLFLYYKKGFRSG